MAVLPKKSLVQKIDAVELVSYPREHLGASVVGDPCKRKTAYSFYWASKSRIPARLNRIFRLGDSVEEHLIKALASVDITVRNSQIQIQDETGHAGGSIDGMIDDHPEFPNEEILFEAKSANHTNYLDIRNKGVQASKPGHYVQMQMYMGRLELKFALYALYDKNTSDIYFEVIPFDAECFMEHLLIEGDILSMGHINEFPRISLNPSWFHCKTCDHKKVCHQGLNPERNCRTCEHSRMGSEGIWYCTHNAVELDGEDQANGCIAFELGSAWK